MSLELGGKNKSILYLNMVKSGMEANNDPTQDEVCTVTSRFANQPFVADQSKYLCAVTRFSVPLIQVHTIAATGFDVYMYTANDLARLEDHYEDPEFGLEGFQDKPEPYFKLMEDDVLEDPDNPEQSLKKRFHKARVDISASFSFYEFLEKLSRALTSTEIDADYDTNANHPEDADAKEEEDGPPDLRVSGDPTVVAAFDHADNDPKIHPLSFRKTLLAERVKMSMTVDMRFKVMITDDIYQSRLYIKMDKGMFRMLQFQETPAHLIPEGDVNPKFALLGRRFHGYSSVPTVGYADVPVGMHLEQFSSQLNQRGFDSSGLADGVTLGQLCTAENQWSDGAHARYQTRFQSTTAAYDPIYASYTAHMCCADNNRLREIVFVTDLMVRSEAQAGSSYKRFLCDYQILNPTKFGYEITHTRDTDPLSSTSPFISRKASVEEVLPSHRYYASDNASAGRWQELTSPEPLHDVEVRAMVKVWSYEKNQYELEDIRLPAGTQFSVKLIFVSKENQAVAVVEKPDKYHT